MYWLRLGSILAQAGWSNRVMRTSTMNEPTPGPLTIEPLFPAACEVKKRRHSSHYEGSREELPRTIFKFLIPVLIVEVLFRAVSKGLWFDEILTTFVSGQTHLSGLWNLLVQGVDGHPPGNYLIERVMGKLGGNERVIFRLPALTAFICVFSCMFSFIRQRAGSLIALVSVSALLITNLYNPFAFEARSYGLMIACITIALMCYVRSESKVWAFLFAVSLAAACSMHFYAVLAFFPFGLAELAYIATERKFRPRIWLAFVAGAVPYVAFWPILRAQRVLYGAHFWATPTFANFAKSLGELTYLKASFSLAIFTAALFYLVYLVFSGKFRQRPETVAADGYSAVEAALILGFFAMPVVTYAIAKIGHGGLSGRYLTVTDLGICLVLSLFLSRMKKPAIITVGLFIFCMFLFQEGTYWADVLRPHEIKDLMAAPEKMSERLDIPLVVSNGLVFLPVWQRADEQIKSRLYFLADPQEQVLASGSDTTTLLLMTLKKFAPIQVESFPDFSQNHRKFLLYSNGDIQDFWPRWLVQHGYSPRAVYVENPPSSVVEDSYDPPKAILYMVDLDERK
jgi:hypothetical protein